VSALPANVILGSWPDCDVVVDDHYVSGRHAMVHLGVDFSATITDLGSTNGTRIERDGGVRDVTVSTPLEPGDVIIVGRTRIPWRAK
jgi:pSer/pThr/pTyr-binding forkhead associated (FHA) protein